MTHTATDKKLHISARPAEYLDGQLCLNKQVLADIAQQYGTPLFVYSADRILARFKQFQTVLYDAKDLVCYAVKANSNIHILRILAEQGAGFDIVSGGELMRVLQAGGDPAKTIFSGVGKSHSEIELALEKGIACFNIESAAELDRIVTVASSHGKVAPISFRVNPDVDAKTHPHISTGLKNNKFGIAYDQVVELYQKAAMQSAIEVVGMDCHIGSQIMRIEPYRETSDRMLYLLDQLKQAGIALKHLDLGGGFGIDYSGDEEFNATQISQIIEPFRQRGLGILLEPGRSIVGDAGVLLTRIEYLKHNDEKSFAICDAAMTELIRPALYQADHRVLNTTEQQTCNQTSWDMVGPVCESSDVLKKNLRTPALQGDVMAIMDCGAYSYVMASNYNTRPKAAEVLLEGDHHRLIRRREGLKEMLAAELDL